jgi:predicted acetyltransferase
MCRLRHTNDPVLSLLKMEDIRSFFALRTMKKNSFAIENIFKVFGKKKCLRIIVLLENIIAKKTFKNVFYCKNIFFIIQCANKI